MKHNYKCNIGLHYHLPVSIVNGNIYTYGFFGVFLDCLANYCKHLTYFSYIVEKKSDDNIDYRIKSKNISIVNTGKYSNGTIKRIVNSYLKRKHIKKSLEDIDFFIIRAPTALCSFFHKLHHKIAVMLIGEYPDRTQLNKLKLLSNIYNTILYKWMECRQDKVLKTSLVLPNSERTFKNVEKKSKKCIQIKTTSISEKNIFYRKDTCDSEYIKLLFVGRLEESKGIFELYHAIALLKKDKIMCKLSIVGFSGNDEFKKQLNVLSDELGINDMISFIGYVPYGESLYKTYRCHDIFIMPTKFDAFPRTITEAMSQSLPVITTKVGGIPDRLTHGINAILIDPGNVQQIVDSVKTLKHDPQIRMSIIKNGLNVALDNTLEKQTPKLINIIDDYFENNNNSQR